MSKVVVACRGREVCLCLTERASRRRMSQRAVPHALSGTRRCARRFGPGVAMRASRHEEQPCSHATHIAAQLLSARIRRIPRIAAASSRREPSGTARLGVVGRYREDERATAVACASAAIHKGPLLAGSVRHRSGRPVLANAFSFGASCLSGCRRCVPAGSRPSGIPR